MCDSRASSSLTPPSSSLRLSSTSTYEFVMDAAPPQGLLKLLHAAFPGTAVSSAHLPEQTDPAHGSPFPTSFWGGLGFTITPDQRAPAAPQP